MTIDEYRLIQLPRFSLLHFEFHIYLLYFPSAALPPKYSLACVLQPGLLLLRLLCEEPFAADSLSINDD